MSSAANATNASQPPILMATPIQSLEATDASSTQSPPPDPSVTDLLNEMEQEVFQAKQSNALPMPLKPTPPVFPDYTGFQGGAPSPPTSSNEGVLSKWIQLPHIKTAVVAMLLALALFYPHGIFPALYQRFSRFSTLESYDLFIRIFLLGVFFYIILVAVPY